MACEPVRRLREGRTVSDLLWDELYPKWVRDVSRVHWTPVDVARRAAAWLVEEPGARVLDVGSGAGKFCLVGALTTEGVFTGVEQRPHLHDVAREVQRRCRVPRCRFVLGDAMALDWSAFDAFYLFNPFAEHIPGFRVIDAAVDFTPERYGQYIEAVRARLAALPVGTRVVTYHGFGGEMPAEWEEEGFERRRAGPLSLFTKQV